MDYKKEREKIISSAKKSLVELRKVAEQVIDLSELDPEKAKQAAASKRLAVEDSFAILQIIQEQEDILVDRTKGETKNDFFGVESKIK